MLKELRALNHDRIDVDEAIGYLAYAKMVQAEYEHAGIDAPDWLDAVVKSLRRTIREKTQDRLQARLSEATSRMETLKTPEQKRSELKKEIADLNQKLQAV